MNVFDFDGTLYCGDSTIDFWLYAIRHNPSCLGALPRQIMGGLLYLAGFISKDELKERFYAFLPFLRNSDDTVLSFWATHENKMNAKVMLRAKKGDVVVSASPEFLLRLPCARNGLELVASDVDLQTGRMLGPNCRGEQKVVRLRALGYVEFEDAYSDSMVDAPMMAMAKRQYLVAGDKISSVLFDDAES